ncbi:MAG TPA: histidine kinase [Prolixibacteraceae bacterium]|nr:histidine kinase [Prolixibacteraceae bacterium]
MKRPAEILVHIFFWIAFVALTWMLTQVYLQANPEAPFSKHLGYVIFLELVMGLLFFYLSFFGIRWAGKRKGRLTLLAVVLLILLAFFAFPATRHGAIPVLSSLIPHILLIFLGLIFRKYSDVQRMQREKQEQQIQNIQTELAFLKMQLSPHFLFNTLNNIDYLVQLDPLKASESISKLGNILRYMIYDAEAEKISLAGELKNMEDYIELLRLRVLDPDYLSYKPPVLNRDFLIAPMLFLPLMENAFKHASTREGKNSIQSEIKMEGNLLTFTVSNPFNGDHIPTSASGKGLGLQNVKRRLELIYPGKHNLHVKDSGNMFVVELKLELDEDNLPGS